MHTVTQDRPPPADQADRRGAQQSPTAPVRRWVRASPSPVSRTVVPPVRVEVLLLAALYAGYAVSRALVDQAPAQAVTSGWTILRLERLLGLDVERAAIDWLVQSTRLSVAASYAYATLHYVVTPAVLVWLYARRPAHYRPARSILVTATCLALVCYWLVPTAPPRLLSPHFVDVLASTSHWGWWGTAASAPRGLGALTNQYAALPSMHVGWALWAGAAVATVARRRIVQLAAAAYPVLVSVVVVATGNHYVLDVLAGALAVAAAGVAVRYLSIRPLHLWRRTGGGVSAADWRSGIEQTRALRSVTPPRTPRAASPARRARS